MPEGCTGFVFMRIPPAWISLETEDKYHDYLGESARSTSRISAISSSAIDKFSGIPGKSGRVRRFWEYYRTHSCPDEEWSLPMDLEKFSDGPSVSWPRPCPSDFASSRYTEGPSNMPSQCEHLISGPPVRRRCQSCRVARSASAEPGVARTRRLGFVSSPSAPRAGLQLKAPREPRALSVRCHIA